MASESKKGPGKSGRNGMTLEQLFDKFTDDAAAEAWFVETFWPDGITCPRCEGERVSEVKHPTMPYFCADCRKRFSPKTGTLMEGSNLGYHKWAIAIYILTTNIRGTSSMKMHRDLGITQKTSWFMAHRIRENWATDEVDYKFGGPVEADETYIGGSNKNRHANKKLPGRGVANKTPVVGVIDLPTNLVATQVVESTNKATLQCFVVDHTETDAPVYTDEHRSYVGINHPHEAVNHSAGEYVRDMAHTAGMDSHWAMFKRGIMGNYYWVSVKHLQRYANEFSGRHNDRPMDTVDQMESIVRGMQGKRLRYEDLIA